MLSYREHCKISCVYRRNKIFEFGQCSYTEDVDLFYLAARASGPRGDGGQHLQGEAAQGARVQGQGEGKEEEEPGRLVGPQGPQVAASRAICSTGESAVCDQLCGQLLVISYV